MYHWTACPTYKKHCRCFATRCFGTVSASFSRRKARDKTSSPPEIHLTVLFVRKVLKQTRNMDTFFGGIISKTSSTWNVVNNKVFHGQNPLLRPGKHNNINILWWARQVQIVASFVGRPPGKTCIFSSKGTTKLNHGHVIARKHMDLVHSSSAR